MVNLDTHMVVALLSGDLSASERTVLRDNAWMISDIVLWELARLVQLGHLELDFADPDFKKVLQTVTIVPITAEIAEVSTRLDFRSDPGDELIAATSVVRGIPLLTRATVIRRSRMTPLVNLQ